VHGELELSEETRDRMAELRALSDRAEAGDKQARRKLRLMVRASSAEVVGRASDVGRRAGRVLARSAAGGDPLAEEALCAKLDRMRAEIAGEDPTPLEVLLTERVVSLWMLTTLLEVLLASQYRRDAGGGLKQALAPLPHPAVADTRERHQALLRGHKGASQGEKAARGATVRVSAQAAALRGSVGPPLGAHGWSSRWPRADRGTLVTHRATSATSKLTKDLGV
jgi:hypothetical protein